MSLQSPRIRAIAGTLGEEIPAQDGGYLRRKMPRGVLRHLKDLYW